MMKKYLALIFVAGLIACGDIPREAGALQYGADVNRGECASGYARQSPGLCIANTISAIVTLTGTACTNVDLSLSGIPLNARAITVSGDLAAFAQNAVALRTQTLNFYSGQNCVPANNVALVTGAIRETAATAGELVLAQFPYHIDEMRIGTDRYISVQALAGTAGFTQITQVLLRAYKD